MSNVSFIVFSPSLNLLGVADISVGYSHTCGLFHTGKLVCWGNNIAGELGAEVAIGTYLGNTPTDMSNLVPITFKSTLPVVQVDAGTSFTCSNKFIYYEKDFFFLNFFLLLFFVGLFPNGSIVCFGRNDVGQLGRDNTLNVGAVGTMSTLDPISFSDSLPAVYISAGTKHACAIFGPEFKLRCWGDNTYEQLGDTTDVNKGSSQGLNSIKFSQFVIFDPTINAIPIIMVSVSK